MTLPKIHFTGRNLGFDEDGQIGWEDLKNTYFRPLCGGSDCVTLERQVVPGTGSAPCVFLEAVPPRNPYYPGDVIIIRIQAPCPPTGGNGGEQSGGQDAGQDNGGQDAGQDDGGQSAGQEDGGQDSGGQTGASPAGPS
jgi:hypothetical protein